jgi:peptide/nickel transport system ATP-binding protein
MAVLMITHDLPTALAFSDRVLVMQSGRLVSEGTPDRIRAEADDAYTRELLDATPGRLAAGAGSPAPESVRRQ